MPSGRAIFDGTCDIFEAAGEPTPRTKTPGVPLADGFFHGLGHGVGLEVHEAARAWASPRRSRSLAGDVVTVEPGLYRQGYGGVRLEDLVLVTAGRRREPDAATPTTWRRSGTGGRPDDRRRCSSRSGAIRRPPAFAAQANAQADIYDDDFDAFWEREGRSASAGSSRSTQLYEWELPYAKWFLGGKLNVSYNCVDRHVEAGRGDKVAYHWEGEPDGDRREITYADLQREVVAFANALKQLGVGKGTAGRDLHGHGPGAAGRDARLRAARRAAHGRLRRLLGRLAVRRGCNDMGCEVLITQDEAWRRGTTVPLKVIADEALASAPGLKASSSSVAPATTCR